HGPGDVASVGPFYQRAPGPGAGQCDGGGPAEPGEEPMSFRMIVVPRGGKIFLADDADDVENPEPAPSP
ncbi:hypothetical protein, partial [Streptomyces sp. AC154]|uniref:hypothetical protein n=1 Tax=Streptomyces sp. AC154 TaxID=3143184 RepID=UPI003F823BC4